MRNIRIKIEYDGTDFEGWQKQRQKTRTVQGEIEKALRKIFGNTVKITGSGRTDSGVHAKEQVANFKVTSKIPLNNIKKALNRYLPKDIAIVSLDEVNIDFHSRFDAKGKLYRYSIIDGDIRSPLLSRYVAFIPYKLNVKDMKIACKYFIGKKDFKSFQASDKKHRPSIRTIKRLDIKEKDNIIEIYIKADGFLYNMVRNIIGTLIDVGRGRTRPEYVRNILSKRHRSFAGQTAPANGLCLVKVFY